MKPLEAIHELVARLLEQGLMPTEITIRLPGAQLFSVAKEHMLNPVFTAGGHAIINEAVLYVHGVRVRLVRDAPTETPKTHPPTPAHPRSDQTPG